MERAVRARLRPLRGLVDFLLEVLPPPIAACFGSAIAHDDLTLGYGHRTELGLHEDLGILVERPLLAATVCLRARMKAEELAMIRLREGSEHSWLLVRTGQCRES